MRKIVFVFLLMASLGYSQQAFLTLGDSILSRGSTSLPGTFTVLYIEDSTDTFADSLVVEAYDYMTQEWYILGAKEYTNQEWVTDGYMVPGDGGNKVYVIAYPTPSNLRVRRTNASDLSRRTDVGFGTLTE